MKRLNLEWDNYLADLSALLELDGLVGYIVGTNFRRIRDSLAEFHTVKRELIEEYGEPAGKDEGVAPGTAVIRRNSPGYEAVMEKLAPLMLVEQDIEIVQMDERDAIGVFNAAQYVQFSWLFKGQ